MPIVIIPNEKGTPVGKLADAEIHFEQGPLAGLKLVGFAVWESQWPGKGRHQFLRVTVPSREYEVGGEKRRYDLVRPVSADQAALEPLRDCILDAYANAEAGTRAPEAAARQVYQAAQSGAHSRRTAVWVEAPQTAPAPRRAAPPRPSATRDAAPAPRRPGPPRATGTDDDVIF
jgi:hypothetical protein